MFVLEEITQLLARLDIQSSRWALKGGMVHHGCLLIPTLVVLRKMCRRRAHTILWVGALGTFGSNNFLKIGNQSPPRSTSHDTS